MIGFYVISFWIYFLGRHNHTVVRDGWKWMFCNYAMELCCGFSRPYALDYLLHVVFVLKLNNTYVNTYTYIFPKKKTYFCNAFAIFIGVTVHQYWNALHCRCKECWKFLLRVFLFFARRCFHVMLVLYCIIHLVKSNAFA